VLLLLIDASRDGSDELLEDDDICDGDACRTEVNKHVTRSSHSSNDQSASYLSPAYERENQSANSW
jgi:hypothetical protein